jgi:hypothetical protein
LIKHGLKSGFLEVPIARVSIQLFENAGPLKTHVQEADHTSRIVSRNAAVSGVAEIAIQVLVELGARDFPGLSDECSITSSLE